jgi:hypothetical protein
LTGRFCGGGKAVTDMSKEKRFVTVLEERSGLTGANKIIKDAETGVLYFFHGWGNGGGLTPLLGKDGNALVDSGRFD